MERHRAVATRWNAYFNNIKKRYSVSILATCFLLMTTPTFAGDKLVLNSGNAAPYITADGKGFYGEITEEIFRRLNIEAKVIPVISARALINANEGIEDGNIARISGLEKKFPNLIQVPGEIVIFEFTAFAKEKSFEVTGWNSFKPYEVGFVTGWKIYEKKVTAAKQITKVRTAEQLFNMLDKKRIDVALYERWGGKWWINKVQAKVHALKPTITSKPMSMYLHKKHAALVPKAAQALEEMKKDGTYKRIYDRNLTVLSNN